MPVEYDPDGCDWQQNPGECICPDHNELDRDGLGKCAEHLCPLLRLDAFHSSTMKTGHRVFIKKFKPSNSICPHHGKRAIIAEPPDLEGGTQREYCIDCIAHALYDGKTPPDSPESRRLSYPDWDKLDTLLGKHGFGGYYDLMECLKDVAGHLGFFNTGIDLHESNIDLPQMVRFLMDWANMLSNEKGFNELTIEVGKKAERV